MKRCITVFAALLLIVGCSAKTVPPQPVLTPEPEELAAQMWTSLSDAPQPRFLDKKELELILDVSEKDYIRAVALFVPEEPLQAQLFLLQAQQDGEDLYPVLQQRLELVRQTAQAWLGRNDPAEEYGRVVYKGGWYCLAVPAAENNPRTQQACELFLNSFS